MLASKSKMKPKSKWLQGPTGVNVLLLLLLNEHATQTLRSHGALLRSEGVVSVQQHPSLCLITVPLSETSAHSFPVFCFVSAASKPSGRIWGEKSKRSDADAMFDGELHGIHFYLDA